MKLFLKILISVLMKKYGANVTVNAILFSLSYPHPPKLIYFLQRVMEVGEGYLFIYLFFTLE